MPDLPHCCAMRLQQSRSAAVIVASGRAQAMTGSAASSSARIETPALAASLTPISLVSTTFRRNGSKKVSNYPGFSSVSIPPVSQSASVEEFANTPPSVTSARKISGVQMPGSNFASSNFQYCPGIQANLRRPLLAPLPLPVKRCVVGERVGPIGIGPILVCSSFLTFTGLQMNHLSAWV